MTTAAMRPLSSRTTSHTAATPTTTASLVAESTKFAPTTYTMGAADVLGLFVENRDSFAHSFDIDALNIHVQLPANSTVAIAIKPTGAGTLEFYCAIPGHKEAGMDGTISVQ
jgi:plastocyanin